MAMRSAVYAGQFYPGNADRLRKEVESFVNRSESPMEAKAVLVPHAGYIYSGRVAGNVFSSVKLPRRFIILGPNHTGRGAALSLSPANGWETPLGVVPVDTQLNQKLLKACLKLQEDASAHRDEHCLEVQIPFLQVMQPDLAISAICVRTADFATLEALGHALARVIRTEQEPVLLVASSDMTHYENADIAAKQDKYAIDQILAMDAAGLYRAVIENDITMCGFAPMVVVLTACSDLGTTTGKLIQYTHSGEVTGDRDQVVGYAGIVIQ
jgi:MEMO1 family protein